MKRFPLLASAALGCWFSSAGLAAPEPRPTEYQVKAAYLSNFGRFVEWSMAPHGDKPFQICVLGRDPFGSVLDATLAGEEIGGPALVASRISQADDSAACRVLFVSTLVNDQLK